MKNISRYFSSKSISFRIIWTIASILIVSILSYAIADRYTSNEGYEDFDTREWVPASSAPFSLQSTWWIWCTFVAISALISTIIWDSEN